MKRKDLIKKQINKSLRVFNTIIQHPLCFSKNKSKDIIKYDVGHNGVIFNLKGDFIGRVHNLKDKEFYCMGYLVEDIKDFFNQYGIKINKLPTKFDIKILYGLIKLTEFGDRKVLKVKSKYDLLKSLDLGVDGRSYSKLIDSLIKWSYLNLQYVNRYSSINSEKRIKFKNISIIDSVDMPENLENNTFIKIRFSKSFLKLLSGKFTTSINYNTIKNLNSESAINLYSYLRSFDLLLKQNKKLKRDLNKFSNLLLSNIDRKEKTSNIKNIIKESIDKINALEGDFYNVDFIENNVIFSSNKIKITANNIKETFIMDQKTGEIL